NDLWSSHPYFHAEPQADGDDRATYTIVIPPPNVTAPLHLGHALNNTLQDILIRLRRMQNCSTLWMPGTDHAGIATQTVVEKRILAEEGKRRTDFERAEFVARVQAWKDEYEARIIDQLKAMGCSCDWDRTRFTMDEVCAKAVRSTFFKLFKDGLIYRGKRLVNWDPATQTVLADDEVEHETVQGHFWYLKYPLVEPVDVPRVAGVSPARREGVPPSRQDSEPAIVKRQGRYLPHWSKEGATYAITFRLADAVPCEVSESWRRERQEIVEQAQEKGRPLTHHERVELHRLRSGKIESFLDAGHGECLLRDPGLAEIAHNALRHFDDRRYELVAWAVMPNHVHAIIRPFPGHELSEIVQSWKSFTSKEINRRLGREGSVWMDEYYDHLIRNEKDFANQVDYVLANPEKAGLGHWPWCGMQDDGSDQEQGQDALDTRGRDARDTETITYVTVATTRPETMLGDTAVAMNPNDPRAEYLIGKQVRLPIVGRLIPIIADEHVVLPDPDSEDEKARFSTGFLKVTPAHDPDDWQIGQRHELDIINVMAPDGSISDKYGWEDADEPEAQSLLGMDRFEAREAIVEWFRVENLLEQVREYVHEVGHSYRSHVPIEPYLSDQWYIAVKKPIKWHGLPAREDTAKMAVPQGLIEGTDVPINSLAGLALKPLLDGRLRFIPDRYAKTYQSWLENLRDWPISRQLWWGHRIPTWRLELNTSDLKPADYADPIPLFESALRDLLCVFELKDIGFSLYASESEACVGYVCLETPEGDELLDRVGKFLFTLPDELEPRKPDRPYPRIKKVEGISDVPGRQDACIKFASRVRKWNRDDDVLDTWFSSALWPFSTLGWPEETPELKTFYPGNVLCTAREIITLWVSRMVMMGQYCAGDIPFSDVYIHAMIQDGQGRKMSKSLGNGIDPLVAIDSHGVDAMRFTLANMTTDTQDIRMPVAAMTLPDGRKVNTSPKFDIGRNFCNKLWNASRFALMNLEGMDPAGFDTEKMDTTDKWILSRLAETISEVTESLDKFKFSEPLASLYRFFWNDLCDWYLEWAKPRMQNEETKPIAQNVLAFALDQTLRLLHPFVPFITEGIFQKLNEVAPVRGLEGLAEVESSESLVIAEWPKAIDSLREPDAEKQIEVVQEVLRTIREIRNARNIPPKVRLVVSAKAQQEIAEILNGSAELIEQLAGVKEFQAGTDIAKPANAAVAVADAAEIYVHDAVDPQAERLRFEKQKQQIEKAKSGVEAKLANENFITRAKPQVVAQAKDKLAQLTEQLKTVDRHIAELDNGG
ncbi:MAG: valine--tRNA ligase, partial [Planctomycetota bacterium]